MPQTDKEENTLYNKADWENIASQMSTSSETQGYSVERFLSTRRNPWEWTLLARVLRSIIGLTFA